MKNKTFYRVMMLAGLLFFCQSCGDKLDLVPQNELTPEKVYNSADNYLSVLSKIYASFSASGNSLDQTDITGLDGGSQIPFIRMFFNCQELPTDEAICGWNDQTIKDFHGLNWKPDDPFLKGIYARLVWNVRLINEFLNEASAETLAGRGITGAAADDIVKATFEARFLRAFCYWTMMDLFGKSTFVSEDVTNATTLPGEISRAKLFEYVESELKAIADSLHEPLKAPAGRVDRGAAWALLARLYLNAEVYTGTSKWTEAIDYSSKVINSGYTLSDNYSHLFMADNHTQTNEIIFAIQCDGLTLQGYGNTTFLVNAASASDKPDYFAGATGGGWKGYVATQGLADRFEDLSGKTDTRALFTTSVYGTDNLDIPSLEQDPLFEGGLHIKKFVNKNVDGSPIRDNVGYTFSDIDWPVFRLPEMYLIYAEAVLRGGTGGDKATATGYINLMRKRAQSATADLKIIETDLTLDFILDERARELYWEGHRRTDLIRYNKLTTSEYLWPWKGHIKSGTAVSAKYRLFPIPASAISANSNLSQNEGY